MSYVDERFELYHNIKEKLWRMTPKFGYDGFGELVFYRTYSRFINEKQEDWADCVIRVTEGTFSIRKDWYIKNHIKWDELKWQQYAEQFATSMFNMEWLPPGRGLWAMGSEHVYERGSMALYNCSATEINNRTMDTDLGWLMDCLMLGVGVGFSPIRDDSLVLHMPNANLEMAHKITDDREGWVTSVEFLIDSYMKPNAPQIKFIYDDIREEGLPIATFGGLASGPEPLMELHDRIRYFCQKYLGWRKSDPTFYSSTMLKTDIANAIGCCVVSGNVRRSAEIACLTIKDPQFKDLKDYEKYPYRKDWGWMSNNSVMLEDDEDFLRLGEIAKMVSVRGEPGYLNLRNFPKGRLNGKKAKWDKARGINPCVTGETEICLADGRGFVRIDSLINTDPLVYCVDEEDKIVVRKMRHIRKTEYNQKILKIIFDSGDFIRVTKNHKIMKKDKTMVEAQYLNIDDTVAVFNRYTPDNNHKGNSYFDKYIAIGYKSQIESEHRLVGKYKFGSIAIDEEVHHIDNNRFNNHPDNLEIKKENVHQQEHSHGENNPNWSGYSHEDLIQFGVRLCKKLNRRFSSKEWIEQGHCKHFSWYRKNEFGSLLEFAYYCADLAEVKNDQIDPRTLRLYNEMIEQGYETRIENEIVEVLKICEACENEFWLNQNKREQACCSHNCSNTIRDYTKATESMRKTFSERREILQEQQMNVFCEMKSKLNKEPTKEEWKEECRIAGISYEMCRPGSPFKKWSDLKYFSKGNNHKIIAIFEDGEEDVYNGTVDDYHNFIIGGWTEKNQFSRHIKRGIFGANCGEVPLENKEVCNIAESCPTNCRLIEDWIRACHHATLYCSTVTLLPTHQPETNAVIARNRRIGVGIIDFIRWKNKVGVNQVIRYLRDGYKYIRKVNKELAQEAGIPKSIRVTTMKPGGCRPWNALTTTTNGIFTLEELFEHHKDGQEISSYDGNSEIIQDGKTNKILNTFDNGEKEVYVIKLSYGLELEATGDHPWFVKQKHGDSYHNIEEKGSKYLTVNDWVKTEKLHNCILDIKPGIYSNTLPVKLKKINKFSIKMRNDSQDIIQPAIMTPDLSWLFGYLWGDGSMSPSMYRLRWIDGNYSNLMKAQRIIFEQFGLKAEIQGKKAHVLEIGSKLLWHWMIKNEIFKYYEDKLDLIPKIIRSSTYEDVIAFIAGLIDADGCVSRRTKDNVITYCTSDEEFSKHFQHVALSVGLVFGRSKNALSSGRRGKTPIWLMQGTPHSIESRFKLLVKHSNKCLLDQDPNLPWSHEIDSKFTKIFGKVESVFIIGKKHTYDVQVQNDPWFYAGAVKSHNTIPKLPGLTSGMMHNNFKYMIRRIRIQQNSPIHKVMIKAGIPYEKDVVSANTDVFEYPTYCGEGKTAEEVSLWEQAFNLVLLQREWSDNAVSNTLNFKPKWELIGHYYEKFRSHLYGLMPYDDIDEFLSTGGHYYFGLYKMVYDDGLLIYKYNDKHEEDDIEPVLSMIAPLTKSVSLLPHSAKGVYKQMPEEGISKEEYERRKSLIKEIDWSGLQESQGEDERFCNSSSCETVK